MNNTIIVFHPAVEDSTQANAKIAAPAWAGQLRAGAPTALVAAFKGLRVALLDNTKLNAIELFQAVARRLEPLGVGEIRCWRKRHAGESGSSTIAEMMKWKPDLVLTGLGD